MTTFKLDPLGKCGWLDKNCRQVLDENGDPIFFNTVKEAKEWLTLNRNDLQNYYHLVAKILNE